MWPFEQQFSAIDDAPIKSDLKIEYYPTLSRIDTIGPDQSAPR